MTDFLAAARAEATRLQHDYVGTEHLLLALTEDPDPALGTILAAFSVTPEALRERVEKRSPKGRGSPVNPGELTLRSGAKRTLDAAATLAGGSPPVARHLLGALMSDNKGVVVASFGDVGVPVAKVREALGFQYPDPGPKQGAPKTERQAAAEPPAARGPERKREKGEPREKPKEREREKSERREGRQRDRERPGSAAEDAPLEARPTTPPRIAPVHQPFFTWRNPPLLAIPLSLYFNYAGEFPALVVFITACVAVLPLAGAMGEATEHLAARTGPTIGGLLNATFGNAAELIIAIVALQAGMINLVKASITGSILGNLLLILGLSLLAGGVNKPIVRFNRTAAGMSAGMMALAVTGLIFPTLFHSTHAGTGVAGTELHLSEAVAAVLMLTYGLSLLFTLKTHSRLFGGDPHPTTGTLWSVPVATGVLALATIGVAIESEILVHAVQGMTQGGTWFSEAFLGLIVIPIIGNAAEHATAVVVARKGKMDLALQIAMGSSTQVALLIAPLLVFIGLFTGSGADGAHMNLVFPPLQVIAMGLSTLLAAIVTLDGESHWFEGVQLLALYAMVAVAVFFV